jgi:hypothetical protein
MHKIAGLHDKPGRVTRLTRLDRYYRRSDRPAQKRALSSKKKVYKPKIREEEVQEVDIDTERTTNLDIIQIGRMNVPIEGSSKRPIVSNNQVVTPTQKGFVAANDHEAS